MTSQPRVLRLDLLRGIAIFAMLLAHANSLLVDAPSVWGFAVGQMNDLASPLFVLVMGMAAQLVLSRDANRSRGRILIHQLLRGLLLIGLGLWAAAWGSWVDIVLAYLGLTLVVAAPAVLLNTRYLIGLGAAVAVAGPLVNGWARETLVPGIFQQHWLVQDLANWTVLGYNYRLTNLLPFFILGIVLQRMPVRSWRTASWVFLISISSYAVEQVSVRALGWAEPVSGSHLDVLRDLGLVLAAYLAAVGLENLSERKLMQPLLLTPLAMLGQIALSIYLLHVWIISLAADWGWRGFDSHYAGWLLLVPGMMVTGVVWRRFVGPGPLEWLMGALLRGRLSQQKALAELFRPPRSEV